jgi:NAD(P)-dependent dehydrogenase (short-subunit alcohol dehydrogenase family)
MLTTPAPSYSAAQQLQNEDILTLDSKQWEDTFQINMHHIFYTSKAAIPHLQKNKGAAIINNASVNAFIGRPDLLDYTCSSSSSSSLFLDRC